MLLHNHACLVICRVFPPNHDSSPNTSVLHGCLDVILFSTLLAPKSVALFELGDTLIKSFSLYFMLADLIIEKRHRDCCSILLFNIVLTSISVNFNSHIYTFILISFWTMSISFWTMSRYRRTMDVVNNSDFMTSSVTFHLLFRSSFFLYILSASLCHPLFWIHTFLLVTH